MSETALTLYDVESTLAAFEETDEMVPSEQRAEFEAELAQALTVAKDKRESFARFIISRELMAANCKAEAKRLAELAHRAEAAAERAKAFGARVIVGIGMDAKGKYRKLEGNTTVLSLRKNPDKVAITDEASVPVEYKTVTVKMTGRVWEELVEALGDSRDEVLAGFDSTDAVVDKRKVKAALDASIEVPGADMAFGEMRLVVS